MSGISSCVCLILTVAHSVKPNGLFNIWYPSPFFYFTIEASWACWTLPTLQPGMDWTHPLGREEASSAWKQRGIVSAAPLSQRMPSKKKRLLGLLWCWHLRSRNLSCLSVDWVYLMRTRWSEGQVPFSPCCLSARPSCFLAADAGFSWLSVWAHSELQQLRDYSGFIDLSKEPQTCWVGVKPGPQHPGSYKNGSGDHGANGFLTFSDCSMILLPKVLKM